MSEAYGQCQSQSDILRRVEFTGALLLTIQNPNTTAPAGDQFGFSVAALGNNLLVGAPFSSPTKVYLFDGTATGTTNTPLLTILNPTPAGDDRFGGSVAGGENISSGHTLTTQGKPTPGPPISSMATPLVPPLGTAS